MAGAGPGALGAETAYGNAELASLIPSVARAAPATAETMGSGGEGAPADGDEDVIAIGGHQARRGQQDGTGESGGPPQAAPGSMPSAAAQATVPQAPAAETDGPGSEISRSEVPDADQVPAASTGGAPAPASGPAVSGSAAGTAPRTPDGLVDYYMETHWDRSEYDAKVAELDLESAFGSAVDHFMPGDTSPGIRAAVNLAYSVSTGMIDAAIIGGIKAIPGVGSILHIATGIKDIWSAVDTYGSGENGLNDTIGLSLNVLRGVADIVGSVVGNIGDLATVVEDVAALFAWTGVGAAIAGVVAFFGTIGDGVGAACDGIKLFCSSASTVHNVMAANEAERQGDFRRAGRYRALARGDALNVIVDGISFAASLGSLLTANVVPGEAPEDMAEASAKIAQRAVNGFFGIDPKSGLKTTGNLIDRSKGGMPGGALAATNSYQNLLFHVGLGDAMAYSPEGAFGGRYIQPEGSSHSGVAGGILSQARGQTVEQFEATNAQLDGNDPKWNQKLVNDILNPPDATGLEIYSRLLSPTAWGEFFVGLGISAGQALDTATSGASGDALESLASLLDTTCAPAVDKLNEMIDTWEPALDETMTAMAESLTQQQMSLETARSTLSTVDEYSRMLSGLMDDQGQIDAFIDGVTSRISELRITEESLGIPDWVPAATYEWALNRYNSFVNGFAADVDRMASGARGQIDTFVDGQTAWVQAQIADIQAVIAEGGEAEQLLQQAYDTFAQSVAQFLELVASFDAGVELDFSGAAEYLRAEAAKQRSEGFENRMETFQDYARNEGQGQVDTWRSEYADDVQQAYYPQVPAHEVAAVDQAYALITARIDALEESDPTYAEAAAEQRAAASAAYGAAQARASGSGREALMAFWTSADQLGQIAAAVGA